MKSSLRRAHELNADEEQLAIVKVSSQNVFGSKESNLLVGDDEEDEDEMPYQEASQIGGNSHVGGNLGATMGVSLYKTMGGSSAGGPIGGFGQNQS